MSDEVSQFLESVERLRGQQIEEDEVRARELEEYLAAKRERQARRQERARSISPQKSSPANTPSPRSSRQGARLTEGIKLEPTATDSDNRREPSATPDPDASNISFSSSSAKENQDSADADTDMDESKMSGASTSPGRSSTLSWQRRPTSRGGGLGGPRPLSMVAAQNATQRSLAGSQASSQEPHSATETSFSRDQIAQNLLSKDPSWFRQTAERGQGSAAYRKNQVEDTERSDMDSSRAQLPGMSDSSRDRSPSLASSSNVTSTPQKDRLASPLALQPPRFDGPAADVPTEESAIKSPPSGRTSPTRAASPTKGMGGFVQSAMMKRSDSVKRWSVQSPPGLTRADSVTSHRSSRPMSFSRQDSRTPGSSRPTSRQGDKDSSEETTPKASAERDAKVDDDQQAAPVPTSPSKTMDPRRWSPTKSSWLDNALNKPESPKPQPKPHTPTQPAWMAELNKNRANNSSQHGRSESKHQVSIGGLMRSTPMGAGIKSNTTDLGGIYSPPARGNRPEFGHAAKASLSRTNTEDSVLSDTTPEAEQPEATADQTEDTPQTRPEEQQAAEPPKPKTTTTSQTVKPKPKPETPPKKDFRANLKQRPADSGPAKSDEPEFKNALGNLRRAKTQNYVAPDELKGNILRGKAALNVTDGPQKSERKDEFKDAILKKKGDFKKAQEEGKGVTRSTTVTASKPLPEGLAKRAELGKSSTVKQDTTSGSSSPAVARKPSSPKPTPAPKRINSHGASSMNSTEAASAKSPPPSAAKPTRVSTDPDVSSPTSETRALPVLHKETSAPSKLQGRVGGGKLADRFNPALAGILARGPPTSSNEGGKAPASSSGGPTADIGSSETPAAGPQLTHMTKGRARGPRRKAPSSAPPAQQETAASSAKIEPTKQPSAAAQSPKLPAKPKPVSSPRTDQSPKSPGEAGSPSRAAGEGSGPLSIQQQVAARASKGRPLPLRSGASDSANGNVTEQQPRSFPTRRQPTSPEKTIAEPVSPIKPHKTGGDVSQPGSPKKLDMKRMSRFLDDTSINNSSATPEPLKLSPQKTGPGSPVRTERALPKPATSPSKNDGGSAAAEKSTPWIAGDAKKSPPPAPKPSFDSFNNNRGSRPSTPGDRTKSASRPLPFPTTDGTKSPHPQPPESPMRSPLKSGSEVATLLTDFFGPDRPRRDYKVDPAELLASRPEPRGKVKTLSCQMHQISGDGKKLPVQAHYERTLFEREMYICVHKFETEAGWKTLNVYFWIGDEVPQTVAEDAQLFAQREAKSQGGNLVRIPQGCETSEFLQALGGAVVCRRGSSNKFDSLAPNMLCGRRHLGEVVFDEIEFDPLNLCTGFPYLIAQGGKCYLWKGKGSGVDELSCAKLIGLDLSLMGELIEYEEGSEPDSFWELFGTKAKPYSAGHWKLKPNFSKYGSRLFCSDAESRQQIYEISPFNQSDLSPASIYVIDAFFEMYIVVGFRAQSQFASFRNALNFAQEYAILAAGMEDRPFVPVSSVVLEGVPRDLKRVFRKWSDERSPTVTKEKAGPGLKRGRSLRVVPLNQALQALSE